MLETTVLDHNLQIVSANQSDEWNNLMRIFDRSDGRDIRSVLEQAVVRQREKSEFANSDLAKMLDQIQAASVLLALLCSALGIVAVAYFVSRMQRPFERLIQATTAISLGNYDHRGSNTTNDEFGQIARRLNTVAAKLETAKKQGQTVLQSLERSAAEKTADLSQSHEALLRIDSMRRQFFAEIRHELRTPVTVIRCKAEIALRGGDRQATDYKATLGRIVSAFADLGKRAGDLLKLAKADVASYTGRLEPIQLASSIRAAVGQISAVAASKKIQISTPSDFDDANLSALMVSADKDRLHQVLMILLDNAVLYSEAQGTD